MARRDRQPLAETGPGKVPNRMAPEPLATTEGRSTVKIVVIGGTGLIGSKLVTKLSEHGHEAVAASPSSGCQHHHGRGARRSPRRRLGRRRRFELSLLRVRLRAGVLRDVDPQPPSRGSGRRRWASRCALGRGNRVPVGERLHPGEDRPGRLIKASPIPYSIVHATQFFESIKKIAEDATYGNTMSLPPVLVQPIAADDVAKALGRVALGTPVNGIVEVAGPEQFTFDMLIRRCLERPK